MTRPANPELPKKTLIEAERLVVELGFEAMTMRTLSERLGVSATAIYHYYPDRSAILSGVREAAVIRLLHRVSDMDEAQGPAERAMRFAQLFIDFARNERNLFSLIFSEPGADKKKVFDALEGRFLELAHPESAKSPVTHASACTAISLLFGFTILAIEGIYDFDDHGLQEAICRQVGEHLLN